MKIIIDADACPVYKEAVEVCKERNIHCILVCDYNHELKSDYAEVVVTDKGKDSADFKVVSMLQKGDLIITQDYGLAALVISKEAHAMHHSGTIYTKENIDKLLFERFLSAKVRRGGGRTGNMKKFTKENKKEFLDKFTEWIMVHNT